VAPRSGKVCAGGSDSGGRAILWTSCASVHLGDGLRGCPRPHASAADREPGLPRVSGAAEPPSHLRLPIVGVGLPHGRRKAEATSLPRLADVGIPAGSTTASGEGALQDRETDGSPSLTELAASAEAFPWGWRPKGLPSLPSLAASGVGFLESWRTDGQPPSSQLAKSGVALSWDAAAAGPGVGFMCGCRGGPAALGVWYATGWNAAEPSILPGLAIAVIAGVDLALCGGAMSGGLVVGLLQGWGGSAAALGVGSSRGSKAAVSLALAELAGMTSVLAGFPDAPKVAVGVMDGRLPWRAILCSSACSGKDE